MNKLHEGQTWARLLGIMKAFADPVRFSIIVDTMGSSKTYRELMYFTRKTKSQISKHVTLLKKLELVHTIRKDRKIYIGPTQLATTLLQTLRGLIIQKLDHQTSKDNKSITTRDKSGVMIPIQTVHDLLKDQAHFLDLLLLTTHINEQEY